jgi:hypothetical protein
MSKWIKEKRGQLPTSSEEIDHLTQLISEQVSEQRTLIDAFNKTMNDFAAERSLETCIEALNKSMQIANIRAKLAQSYEFYARLLEKEIIRLTRHFNNER